MIYKVKGNGWETEEIPVLNEILETTREIGNFSYQLENCVRTISLVGLRDQLKELAEELIVVVDGINDDDEIIEVFDE